MYGPEVVPQATGHGHAHAAQVKTKADKGKGATPTGPAKSAAHKAKEAAKAQAGSRGDLTATGTILAKNVGEDVGSGGTVKSDHSLLGVVDPGVTVQDLGGTILGADPVLGPLQNNGGTTETHALLAGSPAINAGPNPVPVFPTNEFDQRGDGFLRVVEGVVDIGAFEVQAPPTPNPLVITPKFTG
jgi:hypothetical protein